MSWEPVAASPDSALYLTGSLNVNKGRPRSICSSTNTAYFHKYVRLPQDEEWGRKIAQVTHLFVLLGAGSSSKAFSVESGQHNQSVQGLVANSPNIITGSVSNFVQFLQPALPFGTFPLSTLSPLRGSQGRTPHVSFMPTGQAGGVDVWNSFPFSTFGGGFSLKGLKYFTMVNVIIYFC